MSFLAHALRYRKVAFGPFKAHRASRVLTGPQGQQVLEPEVMELLFLLADNADQPVWREEIHAYLWPRRVVEHDALARCVSKLRRALGDDIAPCTWNRSWKEICQPECPPGCGCRIPHDGGSRSRWLSLVPCPCTWCFGCLAKAGS